MVEGLIGKKVGMTQSFDEKGNVIPVTVILAGPCAVVQKKSKDKDGYSAVQLGFVEDKSIRHPNRPQEGHFRKSGISPARILREFQMAEKGDIQEGSQVSVDIFEVGEKVDVVGTSKGKGFAGVIKRWGFHGGKSSHGSMFHRAPGSIGCSAYPSRVVKGKKMPGHMGSERVTVKNLTIVETDKEKNLLIVRGAVPGANGGYLLIKKSDFQPDAEKKAEPAEEKDKPKTEEKADSQEKKEE